MPDEKTLQDRVQDLIDTGRVAANYGDTLQRKIDDNPAVAREVIATLEEMPVCNAVSPDADSPQLKKLAEDQLRQFTNRNPTTEAQSCNNPNRFTQVYDPQP